MECRTERVEKEAKRVLRQVQFPFSSSDVRSQPNPMTLKHKDADMKPTRAPARDATNHMSYSRYFCSDELTGYLNTFSRTPDDEVVQIW